MAAIINEERCLCLKSHMINLHDYVYMADNWWGNGLNGLRKDLQNSELPVKNWVSGVCRSKRLYNFISDIDMVIFNQVVNTESLDSYNYNIFSNLQEKILIDEIKELNRKFQSRRMTTLWVKFLTLMVITTATALFAYISG